MARQPRSRGRLVLGVFGVVAGLAVLVIGAASQMVLLGVAGFAIMAGVALWALLGPRAKPEPAVAAKPGATPGSGQAQVKGKKGRTKDGRPFMTRLEERFERRREQGDL